tara:strand:- start:18 stop:470 length:453 start_codon:yes stop_codon:yes gene_type:complete
VKHFQFYKALGLDAKVGIGMVRGRFVLYFPAKGMSQRKTGNVARNPDRLALHRLMNENCLHSNLANALIVTHSKSGKAVDGKQVKTTINDFLDSAYPRRVLNRGNYAYTLYCMELGAWTYSERSPEEQCDGLAFILRLEPTTNARRVAIS